MLDPALEADGIGPSAFSQALAADWDARRGEIAEQLRGARVLVVGAAGQATPEPDLSTMHVFTISLSPSRARTSPITPLATCA